MSKLENKGDKHCFWNPDIPLKERDKRRYCRYKLKIWREEIYKRDDFICQITGKRGGKLVAHHIESWNSNKELRFEVDNGITLSENIHRLFHKEYGLGNNTRSQFKEFCFRFSSGEFNEIA